MADIFLWIIVALAFGLFIMLVTSKSRCGSGCAAPTGRIRPAPPAPIKVDKRAPRRRRNAGGYYPVDYDGPFEEGENIVDYLVWNGVLSTMTSADLANLGVYGSTDYDEQDKLDDYSELHEESYGEPEAESFEVIEDEPEETKSSGGWDSSDESSDSGWDSSDDSGGWDDD